MFYDMFYDNEGKVTPLYFYDVAIKNNILECPEEIAIKMLSSSHLSQQSAVDYKQVLSEHYKQEEGGLKEEVII